MRLILQLILAVSLLTGPRFHLTAQSTVRITGKVTTTDGQGLPGATVLLRKLNADTTFAGFALTETYGSYQLDAVVDTTHCLLTAQLLGFAPQHLPFNLRPSVKVYQQSFVLQPQALALNEVIVKARTIPLRAKGDTVIYNAGSFADGSERSVEDLLKKLPGIKVAGDGTITAKGKPIDKVLIEGEDLFSRNYKLISRSMAANLIDKIEAIDNFTDNPLLHGVEKSGKSVLNLTIKEDRKKVVFGNIDLQAGTASRYEAKGSLFSLLNRVKTAVIGQMNTIGQDPIPDTEYHLTADEIKQPASPEHNRYSPLLAQQSTENPPLSPARFTFNKARLGAVSVSYRLTSQLKIKAYSYLSADQRRYTQQTDNTYLFDTIRFIVRDSTQLRIAPHTRTTHVQVNYNKPDQYSIQLTSDQKKSVSQQTFYTNSQNIVFPEIVRLTAGEQFQVFTHRLNVVRRLSGKNVLIADAGYQSATLPQTIAVQSKRFAGFLNRDPSFDQFMQEAGLTVRQYTATMRWKGSFRSSFYALGGGLSSQQQQGNTRAALRTNTNQLFTDSSSTNDIRFQRYRFFLDGSYSIRLRPFIFSVSNTVENSRFFLMISPDGKT